MSTHASLDAAAQERKARLAKLKNLKRKAPDPDSENAAESPSAEDPTTTSSTSTKQQQPPTNQYLSGRNFDPETRNAKLGFEHNPAADQDTAERRAAELAEQEREARRREEKEEEEEAEAGSRALDLFKLQPRKANWDLKRDMERRMERLNVRTENAIARAVRERIAAQQQGAPRDADAGVGEETGDGEGEAAGLKGEELVSALHAKELQEEEEERRERQEDEEEEEGFK